MNRRILPVVICVFMLLAAAVYLPLLSRGREDAGFIRLTVLDGRTDAPCRKALVVIPETGKTYALDSAARTEKIRVPVIRDARFDGILERDWGEVTVLVYCDGYYPLALFSLGVHADGKEREATLYLFPDDGSMAEPFALSEGPESDWVRRLINEYAP